jgi:hypothetical protein
MSELRIILDKSVVFGLRNSEIDSLDRYFFLVVPPILTNEILADLAKEAEVPAIQTKIATHGYRISGNRGLPVEYHVILEHSLRGYEVPMDGRFLPAGETTVRSRDGSIGQVVATVVEDETIFRWQNGDFTDEERTWARKWRKQIERPINTGMYLGHIANAGLKYTAPGSDRELVETVDGLLAERSLQGRLLSLVFKHFDISPSAQREIIKRWFREGSPTLKDFAPYAFFCTRANFLWALCLTNPQLFQPDRNDRKDLEYCYYVPHCEIFSSNDSKHKRLVPFLLRPDQTFVAGDGLKGDLAQLSAKWDALTRDERVQIQSQRGNAPPEDESSVVFRLWKEHRNEIRKPIPLEFLKATVVDSRKPIEEQVPITVEEMLRKLMDQAEAAEPLSRAELIRSRESGEADPRMFIQRKTRVRKDRLLKLYPQLTEGQLKKSK